MHIAIDASRTTVERITGTEQYARQLLRHLILLNDAQDTPHRLTLYFRDAPAPDLFPASPYVEQRVVPLQRMWTHLRFAADLWRSRPDVTFVPAHTLPLLFPGRAAVTVHDLGYEHFPQAHTPVQRRYLQLTTRYSASRATVVLADSHATADDLHGLYGIPRKKTHVVYPGVDPPTGDLNRPVHEIYHLPPHYFLFIGTLQPRKNIQRLVQAFDTFQQAHPQQQIGLVLAGKQGWLFDQAWVQDVDNITLPGYIADADKAALLAQAEALVFPSLYEGFGFPVLEAMHCGTPVLASDTSSLPELVGDAGILVDPLSTDAIADGLARLATDADLRETLVARGTEQAAIFTWERTARQTLTALEAASR